MRIKSLVVTHTSCLMERHHKGSIETDCIQDLLHKMRGWNDSKYDYPKRVCSFLYTYHVSCLMFQQAKHSQLVDLWHVASMILIYSPTGIEKATEAKAPRMRRSFISNLDRMRCVQCRSSLVEINSDVRRAPNAVTGAARMSECRVWASRVAMP